jgi:hypothetical protein
MRSLSIAAVGLALALQVAAQGLAVSPTDTTRSVIAAQKGKRVTLRLRSGQELSGVVRDASERLVVIGELAGREFSDAVVPIEAIEAVIVRVRP